MGEELSAEERRLIDAAIEAGEVTKVPTGSSAWPEYEYDHGTGKLVSSDPEKSKAMGSWSGVRVRSAKARKKREETLTLIQSGMTVEAVAEKIGRSANTVQQYIHVLRREGHEIESYVTQGPMTKMHSKRCDVVLTVSKTFAGTLEDLAEFLSIGQSTMTQSFRKAKRMADYEIVKENVVKNRSIKKAEKDIKAQKADAAKVMFDEGYGYEDVAVSLSIKVAAAKQMMADWKEKSPPPK